MSRVAGRKTVQAESEAEARNLIETKAALPTVKQHMAAIRMMFSWLTEKGVLAMNTAREVKTERLSRTDFPLQCCELVGRHF